MALASALQAAGIQLELLTGPLTGIYDLTGMGSMLFAVCAVAAQLDRDYIREKTLEGQRAAASRGNHGRRPKVLDGDGIIFARALRDRGVPIPEIARRVTIKTGRNAGKHPSVASVYRALADTVPLLPAIHHEHRTSLPMDMGHRMSLTGILPRRSQ